MTIADIILRAAIGLGIGFIIGLTGVGGGVLVLPSLTFVLGLMPSVAVGTANLYASITKIFASYSHMRLGHVSGRAALLLLIGAVPGGLATGLWINYTVRNNQGSIVQMHRFQDRLGTLLTVVVILAAAYMLFNTIYHFRKKETVDPDCTRSSRALSDSPLRVVLAIISGVFVGAMIGATSIGGGVIVVPLLLGLFCLDARETVGTSIVIAVVLTIITTVVYGAGGQIDLPTGLIMGAAAVPGTRFGAKCVKRLPEKVIRCILAAVILVAACLMIAGQR
ncbi:MAG: sulfite exporter TauE/SafE family protein [bacterium]|nr:MAG: sulfite exporter TauE/SafE family protein [bacterium]